MKTQPAGILLVTLVALALGSTNFAEAASPGKRSRLQNRVGAYGAGFVGMTHYRADHSDNEQALEDILTLNEIPYRNLDSNTEDSDPGYQLTFGYRFHRHFAAELGLVKYGDLLSTANAELDSPNEGVDFVPADVSLRFSAGGVLFSALGILPLSDTFEIYGRVGYLFANSERNFTLRLEDETTFTGVAKSDSQKPVFGVGFGWNINQVYSIRAEYQAIDDVGSSNTGTEDLETLSLGLIVRF